MGIRIHSPGGDSGEGGESSGKWWRRPGEGWLAYPYPAPGNFERRQI